jgi:hypothetical protein
MGSEERLAIVLHEKGRPGGHVVFEDNVIGNSFGAIFEDEDAPADGVRCKAKEETNAGLAR